MNKSDYILGTTSSVALSWSVLTEDLVGDVSDWNEHKASIAPCDAIDWNLRWPRACQPVVIYKRSESRSHPLLLIPGLRCKASTERPFCSFHIQPCFHVVKKQKWTHMIDLMSYNYLSIFLEQGSKYREQIWNKYREQFIFSPYG